MLIFATNNENKAKEVQAILPAGIQVSTLKEADINQDIPEPYDTLEENALEKARVIHRLTGNNCFSEDTGLEVEALDGAPGVHSARYAGEGRSNEANIALLLQNMEGKTARRARFRTVVALIWNNEEHLFEGVCTGHIAFAPTGNGGFGYDPIFIPEGSDRSFGEMTMEEKSRYSHRKKAVAQLVAFLNQVS
ncbi:RdgB/HAM1 family non-canonical purine NTP pyrophosphatase [Paracnuella aquatica]|uniref:RdgB/HAM1 family non-canonical purine NTP pyrophosphatase n=1 Tax=Paracnuella aquatica TaxID=2268757 RepID=UPI000DEEC47F|nr:RdgB/HAM1 family non-canonical purine NTP pyrophosphatase [Paracnuella aquatica]RPD49142.1 RdgB/HAM1 family non-canonical purine NTP pyrophosphatase [Paracnuella aquatica]